ncbi:MAG: hypothetical protein Q4B43_05380 [Bacteroidota bacterium]|nr:hypothetical protein [Bacteroidota bacterium]
MELSKKVKAILKDGEKKRELAVALSRVNAKGEKRPLSYDTIKRWFYSEPFRFQSESVKNALMKVTGLKANELFEKEDNE